MGGCRPRCLGSHFACTDNGRSFLIWRLPWHRRPLTVAPPSLSFSLSLPFRENNGDCSLFISFCLSLWCFGVLAAWFLSQLLSVDPDLLSFRVCRTCWEVMLLLHHHLLASCCFARIRPPAHCPFIVRFFGNISNRLLIISMRASKTHTHTLYSMNYFCDYITTIIRSSQKLSSLFQLIIFLLLLFSIVKWLPGKAGAFPLTIRVPFCLSLRPPNPLTLLLFDFMNPVVWLLHVTQYLVELLFYWERIVLYDSVYLYISLHEMTLLKWASWTAAVKTLSDFYGSNIHHDYLPAAVA